MSQIYTTVDTFDGNGNRISTEVVNTVTDLAAFKSDLKQQIDAAAELVRLKYITPGAGMMMTYQEKHAQARAVQAIGEAAANAMSPQDARAQFPILARSVGVEAATLWGCALLIIGRYEAFADIAGDIEDIRINAKKLIGDASDAASAKAAYEAITWMV